MARTVSFQLLSLGSGGFGGPALRTVPFRLPVNGVRFNI
ncbi:hypothetical protein KP78_07390 [Jeotgalibacillus soli]|uniref:Uncharacterized protein n=1 Tax=Jeotgalibacillus soli TaxID=889306 RepID=A0A0C2VXX1_9BACL|nr:hypothetical protein KP78_07390 [Jeotgalibacillus soli]